MNKKQLGEAIFAAIKADILQSGHTMDKYPKGYPISRRQCFLIKKGEFNPEKLKLPFDCRIEYSVTFSEDK